MEKNKKNNNIEVVSGDGKNLEISPVSTHLPISKPKINKKNEKKIIIPTNKNDSKQ